MSSMDPVKLCAQVHLAVSALDPAHNTTTIVNLYRALIMELNKLQASSVHVAPLLSYTHLKMADVLQKHTSNSNLVLEHCSYCVSSLFSMNNETCYILSSPFATERRCGRCIRV